jgi:hypothetical protein
MQSLREQIHEIGVKWLGKEYMEHVGKQNYPRMVNDLILHAFDHNLDTFNASTEIRALHRARDLMVRLAWHQDEPAIE